MSQQRSRARTRREPFPRGVSLLVLALWVTAGGSAAGSLALSGWFAVPVLTALSFLGVLTAAAYLIVRFHIRDQINALDLFESVLAPAIVALPGALVIALVAAAQAASNGARRIQPVKAMFNAGQMAAAAGVGTLIFGALGGHDGPTAGTIGAVVLAVLGMSVVNQASFVTVLHLAERRPVRRVLADLRPVILPGWVGGWLLNTSFGILFVAAYGWSHASVPLFLVPLATLHLASRGFASALADRARMNGLHRATRALATPIDPQEAMPSFLAEVRDCFTAEVVDVILVQEGGHVVHRVSAGRPPRYTITVQPPSGGTLATAIMAQRHAVRVTAGNPDLTLASLIRREGWSECLAAPLFIDGAVIGLLCAYDRSGMEGFEDGEVAVMQALANEVAGTIQKGLLLERLLEERRKLSEIVDQTADGIITLAEDGIVLTWNPGMQSITGYPTDEIVGTGLVGVIRPADGEGRPIRMERWAGGEVLPAALEITTRLGEKRWLSCTYTPVHDAEGRPATLIVVARDVTQIHEVERLRDDFIATVSHELRTPLTPIKGWADTLIRLGDRLPEAQREEAARAILRQAEGLERVILNLLEVSRIERGVIDLRDAVTDVRPLVRGLVDDFRAASPHREIRIEASAGMFRAHGDEVCISQIISNLVGNAIKYSPEDRPIDVRLAQHPGAVVIDVVDRGPGIPPHEIERIFDRFHRVHDREGPQAGTGLGLYIARQLASAIGGTLSVQSIPGAGSTFSVTLRPAGGLAAVV